MNATATYAIDRVEFAKVSTDLYDVVVDGVKVGRVIKTWARVGGMGWTQAGRSGQTFPNRKLASKQMLTDAIRAGLIVNAR